MTSLLKYLKLDKNYCLVTHVNPDLDAFSSLLTLLVTLHRLGFSVKGYLEDQMEFTFFLHGWELFRDLEKKELNSNYTLIALDCGSLDRIWPSNVIKNADSIINIDHHFDNPLFGTINICDHMASSTTELLYLLLKSDDIPIDLKLASNIYAGMLFDTGGFRYSNTRSTTFKTASELISLGVNPSLMADRVFTHFEKQGFNALELALFHTEYWEDNQILFSFVSYEEILEHKLCSEDFDGIIDILRLNRLIKYSILIRETEKGFFKGSVRAKEPYEIGETIRILGGGGHKRAAGFSTRYGSIEEIKMVLKNNFKKQLGING
jgi:phosphoesterase RecJ-like protein